VPLLSFQVYSYSPRIILNETAYAAKGEFYEYFG